MLNPYAVREILIVKQIIYRECCWSYILKCISEWKDNRLIQHIWIIIKMENILQICSDSPAWRWSHGLQKEEKIKIWIQVSRERALTLSFFCNSTHKKLTVTVLAVKSRTIAFETLSCNGEQVTIENDLDNEQQTLHFPILGTTAKGKVVMRR